MKKSSIVQSIVAILVVALLAVTLGRAAGAEEPDGDPADVPTATFADGGDPFAPLVETTLAVAADPISDAVNSVLAVVVTALIGVIAIPLHAFALFLDVFAPFIGLPFGYLTNLALAAVFNACQALGDLCLGNQLPI